MSRNKKIKKWNKANRYKGAGSLKPNKKIEMRVNAKITSESKKAMEKGAKKASQDKKIKEYAKKNKVSIAAATVAMWE